MSYLLQIPQGRRSDYEEHAAPGAIAAAISKVNEAEAEAADELNWLMALYARRIAQVERGEWPHRGGTE